MQDARSKIADAPGTLILGYGFDLVESVFDYNRGR
jgi:hypothetical protein